MMHFAPVIWLAAITTAFTIPSSSSIEVRQVSASFPSGTIPCSTFPSAYGAVSTDWLGLQGWSGVQHVPDYSPGDTSIGTIITATSGGCTANSFCSYACPAGYEKSQWPSAQGSTGQTVGGLYCNSNGILELSNASVEQICTAGIGGVTVTNSLSNNVAVCRLDYPGTESMTIPLDTQPGESYPLTCPATSYFIYEGSPTSASYYVNPSGFSVSEACQWGSSGTPIGNWAPVNIGVGQSVGGAIYLALYPNSANTGYELGFNIQITGSVSSTCEYLGGNFYNNGNLSPSGCTVAITGSGTAAFVFS